MSSFPLSPSTHSPAESNVFSVHVPALPPSLTATPAPHMHARTRTNTQTPGVLAGSRPRGIRLSCPSQRAPADHNMFILHADFLTGGPGKREGAFRPGFPEHNWSGICPIMLTRRLGYRDIPDHLVLYPRTLSGISLIMGISPIPIRDIPMISTRHPDIPADHLVLSVMNGYPRPCGPPPVGAPGGMRGPRVRHRTLYRARPQPANCLIESEV